MINILFIEDDMVIRLGYERMIKKGRLPYDYSFAESVSESLAILETTRFDVIVVDYLLEDGTAFDIIPAVKETPVIFVSGLEDVEIAVQAMKAGAFDYLVKDFESRFLQLLPLTIERTLSYQKIKIGLLESEKRYKDIFESSNDLIQSVAPDGSFLYVNPAWFATLKYSAKELKSLNFFDIVHPNYKEHCQILFNRIMTGEKFNAVEVGFVSKNGEEILVEGNIYCKIEDGIPIETRGLFRNVTEKKRAEEKLKDNERFVRDVIDNVPNLIFVKDRTGKLTLINQPMADLYGQKAKELVGKYHSKLPFFQGENKIIEEQDKLLFEQKKPLRYEIQFTKADGKKVWLSAVKLIFTDSKGKPHILGICTDISERKAFEETLQVIKRRYELATEAGKTGVADWCLNSDNFYIDPILKNLLGYEDYEIPNDRIIWFNLTHPQDKARAIKDLAEYIKETTPSYENEYRMIHKDGSIRWLLVRGVAIRDSNGRVYRMVGTATDITDQKENEIEIRKNQKQLSEAQRVAKIGSWEKDLRTNKGEFSEQFFEVFDITDAAEKKKIIDEDSVGLIKYVHPDDSVVLKDSFAQGIAKGRDFILEHRAIKRNGQVLYLHSRVEFQVDQKGKPRKFFCTIQDITEAKKLEVALKKANEELEIRVRERTVELTNSNKKLEKEIQLRRKIEKALKKSEKDYRGLFENAHDAIIILSPQNEIVVDVNQRACEIYGFSRNEFLSKSLKEISLDPLKGRRDIDITLQRGLKYGFETIQFRKDGSEMNLEVSASLVNYKGQEAILSINRDITKRKSMELSLEDERRKRLSAIIDGQEMERRRLARELHDGLGQLLTAVKLHLRKIHKSKKLDVREIAHLSDSGEIIDETIKEVRRISSDLMPSVLSDFGLLSGLQKLADQFNANSSAKVKFESAWNSLERLPQDYEVGLYRIAQEAVNNAIKYSEAKQISIKLIGKKNKLKLTIIDNGKGFDWDSVSKGVKNGTGQGIYNMTERAELLNGKFRIDTTPGKGTTVVVETPINELAT